MVFLRHFIHSNIFKLSRRGICVLGIETSCDDTAVAIVDSNKRVLSSRRYADRELQRKIGGISPELVAKQHREHLPILIKECIGDAGTSFSEIDAISVTTKPGLVIALKEGIKAAIELAKTHQKNLVAVHHMRAHALSAFLVSDKLSFPFLTLLISGGHSLIVLVRSVDDFEILGKSLSGSAGECLDKIAREMKLNDIDEFRNIHAGAAMEILASRSFGLGHLKYLVNSPSTSGADMNFSQLKSSLLNLVRTSMKQSDFSIEDFCASTQYLVTRHMGAKLHACLEFLRDTRDTKVANLVISGGVGANNYIGNAIRKVCAYYNVEVLQVPPKLCTDNGEMIAWTAIKMLGNGSDVDIYKYPDIPDTLYAHSRYDIGTDTRHELPIKPRGSLSMSSLHGDQPIKVFHKEYFKVEKTENKD